MTTTTETTASESADWLEEKHAGELQYLEIAKELRRLEERVEKLTGHLNWLRWSTDEVQTNKQQKTRIEELEKRADYAHTDAMETADAICTSVECYSGDDLMTQVMPHLVPLLARIKELEDANTADNKQ